MTCEFRAFESAPVFLFGGLVYTFGLPSLAGLYFCGKFADFGVGNDALAEESFDRAVYLCSALELKNFHRCASLRH